MEARPRATFDAPVLFTNERDVLFQDIDAAGIVFFARLFDYCHDAFFAFLGSRGLSMAKVMKDGVWGSPLVHAEADYAAPLRFGDRVRVEITRVDLGNTSMRVASRVVDSRGKIACSAILVHVFVDRTTGRPCEVPAEARDALKDCATV